MSRPLRIEFDGAFYHVTSRGNLRDRIFFKDRDKEKFLEILMRTRKRYGYVLHAYALMDNHYHLMIETPKGNLSQIMQNINTSHTVYMNRKYRRNGHLFQGRFKGILVDKDDYLLELSRYIHLNPVRARIVDRPEQSRWTSYRYFIHGPLDNGVVHLGDTLQHFSDQAAAAMREYKAFVEAGLVEKGSPLDQAEAGILLAGQSFAEKVKQLLQSRKQDDEIPDLKRLKDAVPIAHVIAACCAYFNKKPDDLLHRRRAIRERRIAIYLSKVLSGKKHRDVGDHFGIKAAAVSNALKEIEARLETENDLKEAVRAIRQGLLNVK